MGLLGEFESRLERAVEGFFARIFRSGVHPVEIGKRLLRVMEDGKTMGLKRVYVPNVYRIVLSEKDYERLAPLEAKLVEDIEVFVTEAAHQRSWTLADSPRVSFASAGRLSPGEFRIDAEAVILPKSRAGARSGGGEESNGASSLVLLGDDGPVKTYGLRGTIRIGRQSDNEIVLNDPGVSRHHAQVVENGGFYVLKDLGSTNGTIVNGSPATEHRLHDGDRVMLGQTVLEFRRA